MRTAFLALALAAASLGSLAAAPPSEWSSPPVPGEIAPEKPAPMVVETAYGSTASISVTVDVLLIQRLPWVYQDALSGAWLFLWPTDGTPPAADRVHVELHPSREWAYWPDGRAYKVATLSVPDRPQSLTGEDGPAPATRYPENVR